MKPLDQIFLEKSTDKASSCHWYSRYYEIFFEPLRDADISILEWGIDSGFSLRSWREYFTKAKISGIDIRGNYEYLLDEGCTATYIVDQTDINQIIKFGQEHNQEYDIIIDDCTHQAEDMIRTFEIMFPSLKPNGFYVIEDLLTSNDKSRWGKNANVYDRIRQMVGEVSMNGKGSNDFLCSNKIGEVHKYINNLTYYEANIEWFMMAAGIIFIKKMP